MYNSQCISLGIAAIDYIANTETDNVLGKIEEKIYLFQFQNMPSNIYTYLIFLHLRKDGEADSRRVKHSLGPLPLLIKIGLFCPPIHQKLRKPNKICNK